MMMTTTNTTNEDDNDDDANDFGEDDECVNAVEERDCNILWCAFRGEAETFCFRLSIVMQDS